MGKYADSFKGFCFEKKNKSKAYCLMHLYFTDLEGREVSLYHACHDRNAFSTSTNQRRYKLWSCYIERGTLSYLLDNIGITFGTLFNTDRLLVF